MIKTFLYSSLFTIAFIFSVNAQEESVYKLPPEEIIKLVDAPRTPNIIVVPGRQEGLPNR